MLRFAPLPLIISWVVSVFASASLISTMYLLAAVPAAAQPAGRAEVTESPAARLGPTLSGTALTWPAPYVSVAPTPTDGDPQQPESTLHRRIIVASVLGSAVGAYAGLLTGFLLTDDENIGGVLLSLFAGSVAGSVVGASIAGGRPDGAFLGALPGFVLGVLVGGAVGEVGGVFGFFAGFSLTQGIAAGWLARPQAEVP